MSLLAEAVIQRADRDRRARRTDAARVATLARTTVLTESAAAKGRRKRTGVLARRQRRLIGSGRVGAEPGAAAFWRQFLATPSA